MSISHLYPSISPTLSLNFARSKTLDPRITFIRTSTGTRTNELGLIEVVPANSPRFDHQYDPVSGTVRSLGLLIEEQRTNLLTGSTDFGPLYWTKLNSVGVSTDITSSPDSTNSADKFIENTDASHKVLARSFTLSASTTYTFSIFVKSAERSNIMIHVRKSDYSTRFGGFFNLTTKTFTGETAAGGTLLSSSIVEYPNNWFRLTITGDIGTNTAAVTTLYLCDTNNNIGYTGDGTSGIFLWGAQLEQGSFSTSYIPTSGSTATRTVDVVSMTGTNFSSWFNQTEGTLFADFMGKTIRSSITYDRYIAIVGNDPNLDEMGFYTQTADGGGVYKKIGGVITNNAVSQIPGFFSGGGGPDFGGKAILAYKSNDASYTINGVTPVTDNTVELPTFVGLRIFGRARYQPEPSGHISQLIYYPKRLTDTQLINLTK